MTLTGDGFDGDTFSENYYAEVVSVSEKALVIDFKPHYGPQNLIVGNTAVLKPHQRHHLRVLVYRPRPTMQLAVPFERFDIGAKIREIFLWHEITARRPLVFDGDPFHH